ncbi:GNAT family N-acetyltransferase [Sinomonas sp. R1AF57]|uniref:GNAT family N-acetyltransferase n=1 Tax=Sinomonas sp. R1AF57 TaxID=2020377 RepID=UPI00210082E7|nr:GNAT family N-acetyltransferase [Sinomonas sp. R1AF57]
MTEVPPSVGSPEAGRYEIRRFRAADSASQDFPATAEWIRAVNYGFYKKALADAHVAKTAAAYRVDGRELTAVYETGPAPAAALSPDGPIATFASMRKTLNAGYGRLVPAHLVTAVTVRTDHRRRGLLRRLMVEDLGRAKADGVPVAALTASEASIYRRFGYGVATHERRVTVSTGPRFRLAVRPRGRVMAAEPGAMLELAPTIFAGAHRTVPGSVDRQEQYTLHAAGQWERSTGGEDPGLRVAVHLAEDGTPDGYAAYRFRGWSHEPATMELLDLVAATPDAYLGLWDYLGSLDLIDRVVWDEAPADDPLVWALEDSRVVRAETARDMLWLRILDVGAALEARRYAHDGELILRVDDALGLAAGRYRLAVVDGTATVEALGTPDGEAQVSLDIADLSSVYVGGVSPVSLLQAGRIRTGESSPEAALVLAQMLAVERPAHCLTHF